MFAIVASMMLLPAAPAPMPEWNRSFVRAAAPAASAAVRFADPGDGDKTEGAATRMASSDTSVRRRVQPRVAKVRCAYVTCGPKCEIKGSKTEDGDLVYRRPGSPSYREARAEVMFCDTAEAKAAGYREAAQT